MKKATFTVFVFVFSLMLKAQTTQQEYLFKEWNDYFKGVYQLPQNDLKAKAIYQQLAQYSGMLFYVRYAQTFQWGQAHKGGVILLDYSALAKPKEVLAFIMAHEWGHEALGHQANLYNPNGNVWQYAKGPTDDEDAADVYSGRFLAAKGYNVSVVTSFLRNLPANSKWDTHSSGAKRAASVLKGYNAVAGIDDGVEAKPVTYEDCRKCDGIGQVERTQNCGYCVGTGVKTCYTCGGNGGYYSSGYNTFGVWGYWWYVCNSCAGTRGSYCQSCSGTGAVIVTKQCYSCSGTGRKRKY